MWDKHVRYHPDQTKGSPKKNFEVSPSCEVMRRKVVLHSSQYDNYHGINAMIMMIMMILMIMMRMIRLVMTKFDVSLQPLRLTRWVCEVAMVAKQVGTNTSQDGTLWKEKHFSEKGPYLRYRVPIRTFFYFWGPYLYFQWWLNSRE